MSDLIEIVGAILYKRHSNSRGESTIFDIYDKVIKPNVVGKDIGMLGSIMTNLHSLTTQH